MNHSHKGYRNFLGWLGVVALVIGLLLGGTAQSQVISGDIIGTVLDKSGAAVPSATVTALKVDTGGKYTSTVNGAGEYRFGNLPPGVYDISATAPNFATTTVNGFNVDLNRTLTLNITLEVRSATATIEVIGSAPVLDTTTPTISTTFERKQMDLPTVSQG